MLKIKGGVNLKELEKFGFKYGARDKFLYKTKKDGMESRIYIDLLPCNNNNNELNIECPSHAVSEKIIDKLYDLIKADLVEKVSD